MKTLIVLLALTIAGCTDATKASFSAYGEEAVVTCYSGGQTIFTDESTGVVQGSDGGAGVEFKSKTTGKYIRTYADCVVVSK